MAIHDLKDVPRPRAGDAPAGDSRTISPGADVEFSLGMKTDAFRSLVDLADSSGSSLGEVITKAFLLYKAAAEAHQEGKAVGIAPTADVLETEFVGF